MSSQPNYSVGCDKATASWSITTNSRFSEFCEDKQFCKSFQECLRGMQSFKFLLSTIFLTLYISLVQGQPPPLPPAGFIDFDNLPVTRFTCEGKVIGGYYADLDVGCQMFHVCTLGSKDEVQDIKFLCLNGTVFDQETRVCERVDEVDCSKAEQFYDLNLDLYVPHFATPKPTEPPQDLEEEDDFIRPVSTQKPTESTSPRTTTTTTGRPRESPQKTTTTTPSSSKPSRIHAPVPGKSGEPSKTFSSFNYYLKTPHSHVASGYNSQSRQSYIFNHNPTSGEKKGGSYTLSDNKDSSSTNTARKIPSGQKTIVYTVSSSTGSPRLAPSAPTSTSGKTITSTTTTTSKTPTIVRPEEYEEQLYADEYYDDDEYDISSSTSSATTPQQQHQQQQQQSYGTGQQKSPSAYDYRDGRSTSAVSSPDNLSSRNNNGGRETVKSHVSVAFSSSKSTRSPAPKVTTTTTTPTPRPSLKTSTTEEPYYYDDDYPEDAERQEQEMPGVIEQRAPPSSTTLRSALQPHAQSYEEPGPSAQSNQNPDYYDEVQLDPVNVNEHHFKHVDVPRIPFAKPNVPRVLVTNGKPFLPRITRHIPNSHFSKELLRQHGHNHNRWPGRLSYNNGYEFWNGMRSKRNALESDLARKSIHHVQDDVLSSNWNHSMSKVS